MSLTFEVGYFDGRPLRVPAISYFHQFNLARMTPTLHTERLTLRPFQPSDVDLIFALNSDPEVMRYLRPRP